MYCLAIFPLSPRAPESPVTRERDLRTHACAFGLVRCVTKAQARASTRGLPRARALSRGLRSARESVNPREREQAHRERNRRNRRFRRPTRSRDANAPRARPRVLRYRVIATPPPEFFAAAARSRARRGDVDVPSTCFSHTRGRVSTRPATAPRGSFVFAEKPRARPRGALRLRRRRRD